MLSLVLVTAAMREYAKKIVQGLEMGWRELPAVGARTKSQKINYQRILNQNLRKSQILNRQSQKSRFALWDVWKDHEFPPEAACRRKKSPF